MLTPNSYANPELIPREFGTEEKNRCGFCTEHYSVCADKVILNPESRKRIIHTEFPTWLSLSLTLSLREYNKPGLVLFIGRSHGAEKKGKFSTEVPHTHVNSVLRDASGFHPNRFNAFFRGLMLPSLRSCSLFYCNHTLLFLRSFNIRT